MFRFRGPIRILTALFLVSSAVPSVSAQSAEGLKCGSTASLSFVRQTIQPKRHLAGMIMGLARQTPAFNATLAEAQQKGFGQQLVGFYQKQLNQTLLMHTPSWECNMAAAYSAHLSDEQLTSLAAERQMSPAFADLQSVKPQIDLQMRQSSEDILRDAVTELLSGGVKFVKSFRAGN